VFARETFSTNICYLSARETFFNKSLLSRCTRNCFSSAFWDRNFVLSHLHGHGAQVTLAVYSVHFHLFAHIICTNKNKHHIVRKIYDKKIAAHRFYTIEVVKNTPIYLSANSTRLSDFEVRREFYCSIFGVSIPLQNAFHISSLCVKFCTWKEQKCFHLLDVKTGSKKAFSPCRKTASAYCAAPWQRDIEFLGQIKLIYVSRALKAFNSSERASAPPSAPAVNKTPAVGGWLGWQ
jgi:hypothetical protein